MTTPPWCRENVMVYYERFSGCSAVNYILLVFNILFHHQADLLRMSLRQGIFINIW